MKKIFITGGCGFIGSNFIIEQLTSTENKILNLDMLTYAGNNENLKEINENKNYTFIKGDISDNELVRSIFENYSPDSVINFAAETHVDRSIDNPTNFIGTNILGTLNLLKLSLEYYKRISDFKFIHISTDEVFGSLNKDEDPFIESSSYNPSSPYAASKASSDHLVNSWHKTYGLPTIISNCSNNYGPYQFPEKLIPLMIANCIDQKPLPVYGSGKNIRDWLYVKDHCNALSMIHDNGEIGKTYNIGGNNEIKNIDIVLNICSILDKLKPRRDKTSYADLISYVKDRPGHDFRYAINSSKISNELKWQPLETFESGIYKTIEWYLDNEFWWRKIQKTHYNQERLGLKDS